MSNERKPKPDRGQRGDSPAGGNRKPNRERRGDASAAREPKKPITSGAATQRLNKFIAACGVASRRKADELIASGRVSLDGLPVTEPYAEVGHNSEVCVDGVPIALSEKIYLVMNKPRGLLSAAEDGRGRTVVDLLPPRFKALRVYPVGRLDKNSEGLILLTNDGDFAQSIIHPSKGVVRTYLVSLSLSLDEKRMKEWQRGVIINGRLAKPISVSPIGDGGKRFRIELGEGFKREIRLMAEALGNRVTRLVRVGIGRLHLRDLPVGSFMELSCEDLRAMILSGGDV